MEVSQRGELVKPWPNWLTVRNVALSFRAVTLSLMGVIIAGSVPSVGLPLGVAVILAGVSLRDRLTRSGMWLPVVIAGAVGVGAAAARMLTHSPPVM